MKHELAWAVGKPAAGKWSVSVPGPERFRNVSVRCEKCGLVVIDYGDMNLKNAKVMTKNKIRAIQWKAFGMERDCRIVMVQQIMES